MILYSPPPPLFLFKTRLVFPVTPKQYKIINVSTKQLHLLETECDVEFHQALDREAYQNKIFITGRESQILKSAKKLKRLLDVTLLFYLFYRGWGESAN